MLDLYAATSFDYKWDDRGTGGEHNVAFYHPKPPPGFKVVCDVGVRYYGAAAPSLQCICVRSSDDANALQHPVRYDRVWADYGSGANADGSIWRAVPPPGYKALGLICNSGYSAPPLDHIVCIHDRYLVRGEIDPNDLVWNDRSTGAKQDFGCWSVVSRDIRAIMCGGFSGGASQAPPATVPEAWALNTDLVNNGEDKIEMIVAKSTNFTGMQPQKITLERNGFPLHFHRILTYKWQHCQFMLRLDDDSDGNRYYMGTYSQNVDGGKEGGMVFVGRVGPGSDRGKVIWMDELHDHNIAGGFNHPGDMRRLGNVVVIAGQNWAARTGIPSFLTKIPLLPLLQTLPETKSDIPFADKMLMGNGGQAILFYDVSNPAQPRYAGKVSSFFDRDSNKWVKFNKDIDAIDIQKQGSEYIISMNGFQGDPGTVIRSSILSANACWTITGTREQPWTPADAITTGGKAWFVSLADGGKNANFQEISGPVVENKAIQPSTFGDDTTFSMTTNSDGRCSIVYTNVEASGDIELEEIVSV